jgi:hypothetical protein
MNLYDILMIVWIVVLTLVVASTFKKNNKQG